MSWKNVTVGDGGEIQVTPRQLPPQQDAIISLPASLFKRFDDHEHIGMFFAFYEIVTLFPLARRNNSSGMATKVGTQVVGATVNTSKSLLDLEEPVTIIFRLQSMQEMVQTY